MENIADKTAKTVTKSPVAGDIGVAVSDTVSDTVSGAVSGTVSGAAVTGLSATHFMVYSAVCKPEAFPFTKSAACMSLTCIYSVEFYE